ncbi:MAG TPA: PQQ-binding-like beta-propeller repeat protein [Pirellulales bacterium]|nr:PQQ-binding-like beta-propeller repeat protein [Pirellulales bacterium]
MTFLLPGSPTHRGLDQILIFVRCTTFLMVAGVILPSWSKSSGAVEEWPQFRGIDGQGNTSATGLPLTWSEEEHVVWKTAIAGRGWSSPVVSDNTIWLTTALDDERSLRAVAVDLESGRVLRDIEVFRCDSFPPINGKNSYASPTPVIESERLYVHFGTLGTACLDTSTGEVLWTNRELTVDHKEGPGSSPVLFGDLLILNCDGIDVQYVVALDKHSGKIAWRRDRPGPHNPVADFRKAYCTPLVIETDGHQELISPTANRVVAYDPLTGDERWIVRYAGFSNVPRPIVAGGLVLVDTGYMKPQLWAIRPGGSGDVTDTHVVWRCARHAPANPSPVAVGQEVFMVSDAGIASCLDAATGKTLWQERLGGNFSASLLAGDGRVYFANEEGVVTVIEASRRFQRLAENRLAGRIFASPAVVGKNLIWRTDGHLYRMAD